MKFFIKDFFIKCDQTRRKLDLVTFTKEILNGKLCVVIPATQTQYFKINLKVKYAKFVEQLALWESKSDIKVCNSIFQDHI